MRGRTEKCLKRRVQKKRAREWSYGKGRENDLAGVYLLADGTVWSSREFTSWPAMYAWMQRAVGPKNCIIDDGVRPWKHGARPNEFILRLGPIRIPTRPPAEVVHA